MAEKTTTGSGGTSTVGTGTIPAQLAILPLQEAVLFPNTVMPLAITKPHGIKLVEDALRSGEPVGVVALRDRDASPPTPDDVYTVGTLAIIQKMIKVPDGTLRCIISGTVPFKIVEFTQAEPYLAAKVEQLEEVTVESDELTAMSRNLAAQYSKLLSYLPSAPRELELEVNNISDPNLLSYFIASTMRLDTPDKQAVLEERDTHARMRMLTAYMARELEVVELGQKIQTDIQKEMDKSQREYYLRQQLKAIQDELGEIRPRTGRRQRAAREDRSGQDARGRQQSGAAGTRPAGQDPLGQSRVFRHPHLPGLVGDAALVDDD